MLWFDPKWHLNPTHPLAHSPHIEMWERIGRAKMIVIKSWDKGSLLGEVKATHTSKENWGIHSPVPMAGMFSAISRTAELHCAQHQPGKTNIIIPHAFPFLLLIHTALYTVYNSTWSGISLSAGISCVPTQLLVHPQSHCWWGGVRSRKDSKSVWALLSSN